MDQKKYNVTGEEEFHIAELTGGTYEKIRMIELQTSFYSIQSKQNIANEFSLDLKDYKDIYNMRTYYEELVKVLFIEPCEAKFKDINMSVVNRAKADFLAQ